MIRTILAVLAGLAVASGPLLADEAPATIVRYTDLQHPVLGNAGMVAAQNYHAAEAGARVLEDGGNAVDAAIAVGFALAVTLPRAGNLGGGGFMLIHDATSGEATSIDYREMAPRRAHRDMYLDDDGNADANLSRYHHLAAGVPGTVAGFAMAHERFGSLPWRRLLAPAIELAQNGFVMTHDLAGLLAQRRPQMCRDAAACRYFYKADGEPYVAGDLFVQADLAWALERIADDGPDAFYKGVVAEKIVAEMERGGGLVDAASLAAYRPVERAPLRGNYRGVGIVTMPPPSSGGVHLIQMLNILENFDLRSSGYGSADSIHLLAESMRLAYADRSEHLGDPDFYPVPVAWLTGKDYGKKLAATIDLSAARDSDDVRPGAGPPFESEDTTHFSVIDDAGNVVSNTYTLNLSFGSAIAVDGAGFLLNNEMDDFVSKPGVPNAFGLLGGAANAVEAGKRPLSSMTPTILYREDKPWVATGSPGGSRIITIVLQMVVNVIDHEMNIAEATTVPRIHHQWYPDTLQLEPGFSPDTLRLLEARGHTLEATSATMGSLQSVAVDGGVYQGASDPRRPNAGSAAPRR